ncbi:Serine/threonine-protein kinase CTR1, partial [Tetrabaena socialis]
MEVSTNLAQRLKIGKGIGLGAYATVHRAVLDGRPVALKRPRTRERCTRQTLLRASMQADGGSYSRCSTMPESAFRTDPDAVPAPSFASMSQPAGRAPLATGASVRASRLGAGAQEGGGANAAPASALFLAVPPGSNAAYAVDVNNKNMHEPLKPLARSSVVLLVQPASLWGSANGMLPAADAASDSASSASGGGGGATRPADIWWLSETGEEEAARSRMLPPAEGGGEAVAAEMVYRLTGETGSAMSMAPEVRLAQPYNEKIDVYAFGIFLFELWSRSLLAVSHIGTKRPDMPKMLHQCDDWADLIAGGYRPQRSNCTPELVWCLIEDCWHADPLQRPSMQAALERLQQMAEEQAEEVIGLASGKGGKKLGGGAVAAKIMLMGAQWGPELIRRDSAAPKQVHSHRVVNGRAQRLRAVTQRGSQPQRAISHHKGAVPDVHFRDLGQGGKYSPFAGGKGAMSVAVEVSTDLVQRLKIGKGIGLGAYATVHRAVLDGRPVALKVLLPHHTATGREDCPVLMFTSEGELLRRLDHSHMVKCHAVLELPPDFPGLPHGYVTSTRALALELLEEGSLSSLMHRQLLQPWKFLYDNAAALQWSTQVASALAYLHGCSPPVIHRDVKLENVILAKAPGSKELVVKMVDLGLHTVPRARERCTRQTLLRASMQADGGSYSRRSTMPESAFRTDPDAVPAPSFASMSQPAGRAPLATGASVRASRLGAGPQEGGGANAASASALFLALPEGSNAPYAVDVNNKNMHEPLKPLAWSPAVRLVQPASPWGSANGMPPAADAASASASGAGGGADGGGGGAADMRRVSETGEEEAARSRLLPPVHPGGECGGGEGDGGGGQQRASPSSGQVQGPCAAGEADSGPLAAQPRCSESCGTASTPGGTMTGATAAVTASSGTSNAGASADREPEAAAEAAARWCGEPRNPGGLGPETGSARPTSLAFLPPLAAVGQASTGPGASPVALVSGPAGNGGERARPNQHSLCTGLPKLSPLAVAAAAGTAASPTHGTPPTALRGGSMRRLQAQSGAGWDTPTSAEGRPRPARTPSATNFLLRQSAHPCGSDNGSVGQCCSRGGGGSQLTGGVTYVRQASCLSRPATAQDIQFIAPADGGGEAVAAARVYRLTGETGSAMSMAPEVRLAQPYNEKVDVYAFGIFLFELWSRSLLAVSHIGTKRPDMPKMLHQCDDWPDLIARGYRPQRSNCTPELVWCLIEDCWHADPLQRPSMQEALERLQQMAEEQAEEVIGLASGKGGKKLGGGAGAAK